MLTSAQIRAAREAEGLTQQQVADALGVSLRAYQVYESTGPVPQWFARRAATMIHRLHDVVERED